jgi:hypothetical protein
LCQPESGLAINAAARAVITSSPLAEELVADEASVLTSSGHPGRALAVLDRIAGGDRRTRVVRAIAAAPALAMTGRTAEAVRAAEAGYADHYALGDELAIAHPAMHIVNQVFALTEAGRLAEAELTGRQATDRNAKGRIITPPNAPVGEVLEVEGGIKIFAGPRTDSFFNFIPFPVAVAAALKAGTFPDLAALFPSTDTFLNNTVRSVLVEAPAEVAGRRWLNYCATTAIYDRGTAGSSSSAPEDPTARLLGLRRRTRRDQHQRHHPDGRPRGQARPPRHRPRHRRLVPGQGPDRRRRRGRWHLQPGDPRPAHPAGLRRVRGRHIPPHGHPVHPRHQRPVGPLAGG